MSVNKYWSMFSYLMEAALLFIHLWYVTKMRNDEWGTKNGERGMGNRTGMRGKKLYSLVFLAIYLNITNSQSGPFPDGLIAQLVEPEFFFQALISQLLKLCA